MKKIAIVSARGIGDGLITAVLANNLQLNHYQVTLFSNPLTDLKTWFPGFAMESFPAAKDIEATFNSFDAITFLDTAPIIEYKDQLLPPCYIFYRKNFNRSCSILWNINQSARQFFELSEELVTDNGIVVPQGLSFRKHHQRVIIHPMSSCNRKNWPAEKFLELALILANEGLEPQFIVSPAERPDWQELLANQFPLPEFKSLDNLARYIYESGFLIGNDSGLGHIASNLSVPTLSIFGRHRGAILWRPAWGHTEVVLPLLYLPGASLQMRYWKKMISVQRVLSGFKKLQQTSVICPI